MNIHVSSDLSGTLRWLLSYCIVFPVCSPSHSSDAGRHPRADCSRSSWERGNQVAQGHLSPLGGRLQVGRQRWWVHWAFACGPSGAFASIDSITASVNYLYHSTWCSLWNDIGCFFSAGNFVSQPPGWFPPELPTLAVPGWEHLFCVYKQFCGFLI